MDTAVGTPARTSDTCAMPPVSATEAEVLAVDGADRPALLRRRIGAGARILCAYPLKHLAAGTPRVNPNVITAFCDVPASESGADRTIHVGDSASPRTSWRRGQHPFRRAGEPGGGAVPSSRRGTRPPCHLGRRASPSPWPGALRRRVSGCAEAPAGPPPAQVVRPAPGSRPRPRRAAKARNRCRTARCRGRPAVRPPRHRCWR